MSSLQQSSFWQRCIGRSLRGIVFGIFLTALLWPATSTGAAAGAADGPAAFSPAAWNVRETAIDGNGVSEKLSAAIDRFAMQVADIAPDAMGAGLGAGASAWQSFLQGNEHLDAFYAVDAVNRYVNMVPYRPDARVYGLKDHWATPFEFLALGGDCEDFALAKYFALRQLGIDAADLRLVIGFDEPSGAPHAVLLVRDGATIYILDNLREQIIATDAGKRFKPFLSVNEQGVWLYRSI